MYEAFYGLKKPPFANIPDPTFLYPSPQHKQALSILQYALIARAGFCVITGDVGAGKTTLLRRVLQTLDQPIHVGLVSNTKCESFDEFFRWILLAFDLDYRGKDKVEMYDTFVRFLIAQYEAGEPVTLIIDEAQNLGMEYLEQLRMLSNVNTEKGQILQTILVGQPELWVLLKDPQLEQFSQRISYDYFLKPLDSVELVREYIEYRLENSGATEPVFEDDTFELIRDASRGVPRLINLLCDTALIYGYGEEQRVIGKAIIEQVVQDRIQSFTPVSTPVRPGKLGERRSINGALRDDGTAAKAPSTIERAALRNRKDG